MKQKDKNIGKEIIRLVLQEIPLKQAIKKVYDSQSSAKFGQFPREAS